MANSPLILLFSAVFGSLLLLATISDLRFRRVPNGLNLTILVTGVLVATARLGPVDAVWFSAAGLGIGLVVWLPFYALRLLGAGDVKLFAAGAVWLGWQPALVAALGAGLAGGVLGLGWLAKRYGVQGAGVVFAESLRHPRSLQLQPIERRERVPYALAMSVGLFGTWLYFTFA